MVDLVSFILSDTSHSVSDSSFLQTGNAGECHGRENHPWSKWKTPVDFVSRRRNSCAPLFIKFQHVRVAFTRIIKINLANYTLKLKYWFNNLKCIIVYSIIVQFKQQCNFIQYFKLCNPSLVTLAKHQRCTREVRISLSLNVSFT